MLITETTATGTLIKDYICQGMMPVAQIDNTVNTDQTNTESIIYLYTDHLMTNRLATNQAQAIVWRWEGEAFGNTPAQELASIPVHLRFPGQYYDQETNLHYNWNRYYDPSIGRYITSDPIGLKAGLNSYQYALSNPVFWSDPSGLEIVGEWTKAPTPSNINITYNAANCADYGGLFPYITIVHVEGSAVVEWGIKCKDTCDNRSVYMDGSLNVSASDDMNIPTPICPLIRDPRLKRICQAGVYAKIAYEFYKIKKTVYDAVQNEINRTIQLAKKTYDPNRICGEIMD